MRLMDSGVTAAASSLIHCQLSPTKAGHLFSSPAVKNALGFLSGYVLPMERSTTSTYPRYQYSKPQSAKGIRLLELLPNSKTSAPIQCRIVDTELASSPECQQELCEYEVLSYTWEDGPSPKQIIIQHDGDSDDDDDVDRESESSLLVSSSLYAALQRLRLPKKSRMLWVDNVCIDQDDTGDRTCQVKLSHHIYANAQRLLVWLGDDVDTSSEQIKEAFGVAKKFYDMFDEDPGESLNEQDDEFIDEVNSNVAARLGGAGSRVAKSWDALAALFSRPWFSRVWTVPEIVLAQQVRFFWGAHQLDWGAIQTLASSLKLSSSYLPLPFELVSDGVERVSCIETVKALYSEEPLENTLLALMSVRNQVACDRRDKYNAVLGLLKPELALEPEYGLEPSALFRNIAFKHLSSAGLGFDFLAFVDGVDSSSRMPSLPSWAPDWSQTGVPTPFMFTHPGYKAHGTSRPNYTFSASGTHLFAEGIALDVLQEVGTALPLTAPPPQCLQSLCKTKAWFDECAAIFERHGAQAPAEDRDFWRALTANQDLEGQPLNFEDFDRFAAFAAFYRSGAYLAEPSDDDDDAAALAADAAVFEEQARRAGAGRAFFATVNGRVGWAPRGARAGDIVCMLLGAATPFVLRPQGQGEECRVLGECYLHGFMDGEADAAGGVQSTVFTIV